MRIAIAQIAQETDTFNPVPTGLEDFELRGLYFGGEILQKMRGVREIGGFLAAAEEEASEIEPLPIVRAAATSGGRVTAEALEFFEEKLVSGLRKAQPVDGLFLSMHGAAASEKVDDVEGYLLAAVRGVIGDDVPVVVPLDHHANITKLIIESADVIVGYQEQPHDPFETGVRAAAILFALAKGEISPTVGWQKIPMVAPSSSRFETGWGPMKEWFDLAREMEKRPGVISVSNFPMQPWLDVLEAGWTVVVYADNDPGLAQELATDLANKAWELRGEFWISDKLPPEEVIRRAVEAEEGPIIISDGSDSVLAGAPGDSTCLLKEMLKQEIECTAFLPIVDPEVVEEAIRAGVGSEITVLVGGKRDNVFSEPVEVTGRVTKIVEDGLSTAQPFYGFCDMGRAVLLEVGSIRMVVSEHRGVGGIDPEMYRRLGLEAAEAKMVVVKANDNFQMYDSMMKGLLRADCPGLGWWDLKEFDWVRAPRPIYPLDELPEWQAKA
jgi:microcystin degradation protein MlrC